MKLTRNSKILLILIISCVLIQLSNSLSSKESSTSKESESEEEEIFSMKHKKIRTATTAANKKSTAQTQAQKKTATNTNVKKASSANQNKNTMANKNMAQNKNKQVPGEFSDNLFGANSDLLQQTGLLDAANDAMGKTGPVGAKKNQKLNLEEIGPIVFKGWVKFFKYEDTAGWKDRDQRARMNALRKFFINPEYREQLKLYPGEDYAKEKSADGERKYIASPNDFYLVTYKQSIVFFNTKMV